MITIYNRNEENFATLGLGALSPTECDVDWEEGGRYDLTMKYPILDDGKWIMIQTNCIIRAPSPVRESPAVEVTAGESATTTVSREIYKVATPKGGRLNLRKGPSTSSKVIASYKPGTLVAKTGVSGNWTKVLLIDGGRTGWMYTQYISYVRTETENVTTEDKPGVIIKRTKASDQLFRINIAEPDTTNGIVNVEAEHISYDLKWVKVIGKCDLKGVPVETALAKVQSMASRKHDFEIHCLVSGNVTGDYTNKSLLECIRDPEIGFAPQLGARVVCDNFDIWILPDEVRDMGVELRYRKNLKGIKLKTDSSNQIARIYPVGKDKNGEPLYLEGAKYVESSYAEALVGRDAIIEYDVKVGTGEGEFKDNKAARTELERLAQADMDAGADAEMFSMDVNFLDLGDTEEYKQYKGLMIIHPYDTVSVIHGPFGKKEKARLNKCKWNAVTRKYKSTVFGSVQTTQATVYSFDIAPGAVGNGKIAAGAVDAAQLRNLSIQYAKIALATIEQLNADSITALTARINEIVAGSITTDKLYAALAEITTLMVKSIAADKIETDELYAALADVILLRAQQIDAKNITTDKLAAQYAEIFSLLVENINAENIQTDRLGAVLAEFVSMYASVGDFDFATIQNLVANAMSLQQGAAESVYIKNLAVTSANLLSATLGNLVIKGNDGKYYRVFIGSTGEIGTEEVTVTNGEVNAGLTSTGNQIVETNMNVANLNASNLQASSAVINQILTTALTAGKITAAEAMIASATIPALYTSTIQAIGNSLDLSANQSIKLLVGQQPTIYRGAKPPADAKENSLFIQDGTGYIFQKADSGAELPTFYLDENGDLYYAYGDGQTVYALTMDASGDLYISDDAPLIVLIADDGTPVWWQRVKDADLKAVELRITDDAIVGVVRKSSAYQGDLNTLDGNISKAQSTANAASTAASNAQSTANAANTAAGKAQSTANGAADAAGKAQNSANAAQSSANAAQSSANAAQNTANAAQTGAANAQTAANKAQAAADQAHADLDAAQTNLEQQIHEVYSEVEQTAESFEVRLGEKIGKDELRTYMRYEGGTLELGRSDSRYTTQTSDRGFVVLQDGSPMASMEQNTISAPVINAQRMFTIGDHAIRMGASGHLIFN